MGSTLIIIHERGQNVNTFFEKISDFFHFLDLHKKSVEKVLFFQKFVIFKASFGRKEAFLKVQNIPMGSYPTGGFFILPMQTSPETPVITTSWTVQRRDFTAGITTGV